VVKSPHARAVPPAPGDPKSDAARRRWRLLAAAVAVAAVVVAALALLHEDHPGGDTALRRPNAQPTTETPPSRLDSAASGLEAPAKEGRSGQAAKIAVAEQARGSTAPPSQSPTSEEPAREAMDVAQRVASRFPNDPYPLDVLARAYLLNGDTASAEECWKRCLDLDSHFMSAYHCLAEVATAREDHERVEALMRQALALDAASVEAQLTLTSALMELGRFEEALAVGNKCAKSAPGSPIVWSLLGKVYFQLGRNDEAQESYERALALNPNHATTIYGLAMVYRRLGERDKFKEYIERYRRRTQTASPSQPTRRKFVSQTWIVQELVWTCLAAGDVYARNGDVREAERHWLRAAALDPKNIASRKALASLYQQLGNRRESLRMVGQLRDIDSRARKAGAR